MKKFELNLTKYRERGFKIAARDLQEKTRIYPTHDSTHRAMEIVWLVWKKTLDGYIVGLRRGKDYWVEYCKECEKPSAIILKDASEKTIPGGLGMIFYPGGYAGNGTTENSSGKAFLEEEMRSAIPSNFFASEGGGLTLDAWVEKLNSEDDYNLISPDDILEIFSKARIQTKWGEPKYEGLSNEESCVINLIKAGTSSYEMPAELKPAFDSLIEKGHIHKRAERKAKEPKPPAESMKAGGNSILNTASSR